jgi:hypothetical protein
MDIKTLQDTPPWDWPRDAARTFRKTLRDRRATESDRMIAAELAGDSVVIDDDLSEALLAIVGNAGESVQLRARAAISLGPVLQLAYIDLEEDPDEVPITEDTYHAIQDSFQKFYSDTSIPKEVRRRVLEASVRFPDEWHKDAIRLAYASGDSEWMLTAVFAMRFVRGFDDQILEALKSTDPEIHSEAIEAAGNWELDAAWPRLVALVEDPNTPKPLLLAAIGAVGAIRPAEAGAILADLVDSEDEEVSEAVTDALMMAEGASDEEYEEDEDDEEDDDLVN